MLLSAALWLAARDVAVVDVGGGARVVEVRAAITRLDPTVTIIAQGDAQALYDTYGKDCASSDAACWQRAAVAASVQAIVLVGDGDRLVFVDGGVLRAESDRAGLATAVERGLFRDRFGVVVVRGAPAGALVVVDDQDLPADGLLKAGPHVVHVEAKGFAAKDIAISVAGGTSLDVDGALVAAAPAPAPVGSSLWLWPAASVGVAALAAGAGLGCEAVAGSLLNDATAGKDVDKGAYDAVHGVEAASFVVAGVAAVSAVVGASVVFGDEP